MDEAVKNLFLTALACLALAQSASAQALLDPTRPPPGMDRIAPDSIAVDAAPRLQSVLDRKSVV